MFVAGVAVTQALGNHEFDRKLAGAVPFIEALRAPVIAANMDAAKEPSMQGLFHKSVVVERGGRKVGLIGTIASNTKFAAEAPAVAEEAWRLRAAGVDIVVVVSHSGIEVDLQVAAEDPNVDLIVGGHSHTLLYTGTPPDGGAAYDVYPIVVTQASGRKVAVVQAGAYTRYLGNLTAFFDASGELVSAEGNPIYLDASVQPAKLTALALAPWAAGLEALAARVVGRSAVLLEQNGGVCGAGECNLGSFVADAHVHAFAGAGPPGTWTRAAIGITNSGGLRAPLPQGNVTFNGLVTALPFENTVDLLEVRGAGLRAALEQAVASPRRRGPRAGPWARNYFGFLQVSGLRVSFDAAAPAGRRVRSVLALCHACAVPVYEPLQDEEWYPVALNSFLAGGGDGFYVFSEQGRNYEKGLLDTDVLLEYLRVQDPVVQARDGRLQFAEGERRLGNAAPVASAGKEPQWVAAAAAAVAAAWWRRSGA
ncbi:Apyrase [Gryllus bimaculatus]|nr:Apyrase [Gryllus bimaculatus]